MGLTVKAQVEPSRPTDYSKAVVVLQFLFGRPDVSYDYRVALWVNISADDILKYFSYLS